MTDPLWLAVKTALADLDGLDPHARRRVLDTLDPEVRTEVVSLLDATTADGLLDDPPASGLDRLMRSAATRGRQNVAATLPVGVTIGPYRTTALLGRGGMGDVYRARRADGLFERDVALKVVRHGGDAAALAARFDAERRALASLAHPGIARLLDAGTAQGGPADGRPWLAMDLVDGVPVTEHAWAGALRAERVRLLAEIAEAVHHAHRALVVHRDLKPSNVLVGPTDGGPGGGEPRPMLLDFGVAKLLDPERDPHLTAVDGRRPMTRAYAAPEQVRAEPATTATDVHALGVLATEVLTARRPFAGDGPAALEHAIVHEAPPLPSALTVPADGGLPPRDLRGDLDAICLRALAKDPAARYASANDLALDLRRVLAGEPVSARRASVGYRLRRFAGRHRAGVLASAAALAVLLASTGAYLVQLRAERQRARAAADRAEQTSAFLVSLFGDTDPAAVRGDTLTALDLLDRGVERIDRELADQPVLQSEIYGVVSGAYGSLGQPGLAVRFARRALDRLPADASGAARVAAQVRLAGALGVADGAAADSLYRDAVRVAGALDTPEPRLDALYAWGMSTTDNRTSPQRATEILEAAIRAHRAHHGPEDPHVALLSVRLASVVPDLGDYRRAVGLLRSALGRLTERDYPRERAGALVELGDVLYYSNEKDEAVQLYREALDLRTRLYGPDHPALVAPLKSLGVATIEQDPHASEAMLLRAIGLLERWGAPRGDMQSDLANLYSSLHNLYGSQGRYEEALGYARRSLDVVEHYAEPESPVFVQHMIIVGNALSKLKRPEAHDVWDRTVRLSGRVFGERSAVTLMNRLRAGWAAHEMGDAARAEALLAPAAADALAELPPSSHVRAELAYRLGRMRLETGRAEAALEPLRHANAARDVLGRIGVDHYPGATSLGHMAQATLGRALLATGRFEAARRHLGASAQALADSLGTEHPEAQVAAAALREARRRGG